jgi:hypothetical protein
MLHTNDLHPEGGVRCVSSARRDLCGGGGEEQSLSLSRPFEKRAISADFLRLPFLHSHVRTSQYSSLSQTVFVFAFKPNNSSTYFS